MTIFKNTSFHQTYIFVCIAASISGFSDVFGFLALNKLFTAHITGNLVIFISFVLDHKYDYIPQISAIPVFILMAAIISITIKHLGVSKRAFSLWLLLELFLFLLLMLSGIYILPYHSIGNWIGIMISMLPVIAMSIHNTILKTYVQGVPPASVMTGNLIQFVIDTTALCFYFNSRGSSEYNKHFSGFKRFGNVLLGFFRVR